jgi:hypothetical protein
MIWVEMMIYKLLFLTIDLLYCLDILFILFPKPTHQNFPHCNTILPFKSKYRCFSPSVTGT